MNTPNWQASSAGGAKLDTGAKTASLSARDIKRFKRDGESWVRFYLAIDDAHSHPIERPLARQKIKRRSGVTTPSRTNYTSRPVISLEWYGQGFYAP